MKFEEAYRGIRKLHAAQLFKVLFAVLAVALLIITLLVGQDTGHGYITDKETVETLTTAAVIMGISALILPVIGLILEIIGLKQASDDEESFRVALFLAVFSLLLEIAGSVLSTIFKDRADMALNIIRIIKPVMNIVLILMTVLGISKLTDALDKPKMRNRGIAVFVVSAVANVCKACGDGLPAFIKIPEDTVDVIASASSVLGLIAYCMYMSYLSKAVVVLE